LFLLWYSSLGEQAGDSIHAIFATLVPGFSSTFPNMGLTALTTVTELGDGPVGPVPILPLIPPLSAEKWKSPGSELVTNVLGGLLELMVSQVVLIQWREEREEKQKQAFNFLFEKFKKFYMPAIFPDFNWYMSLYKPSLELPQMRHFKPTLADGTKLEDPMSACRVVFIKWIAQYTHASQSGGGPTGTLPSHLHNTSAVLNISCSFPEKEQFGVAMDSPQLQTSNLSDEGLFVREVLYGTRRNINFVHEVYRQSFLLSFAHHAAIKKVIAVYKDWIQMHGQELPSFMLEPKVEDLDIEEGPDDVDGPMLYPVKDPQQVKVRAGLQNLLQLFVTNAANVFLLDVEAKDYPVLLDEQVNMCKRVLNVYRYIVMNVKMDVQTWEQLLFVLLQITQTTVSETPPSRREINLGGRLSQAIFQTLIVSWIKANLYVAVSNQLWEEFLDVLSSRTQWEELIREWFKTMETLTRVLARQVYNLDLKDLPLDRLSEQKSKRIRGKTGGGGEKETVMSNVAGMRAPSAEIDPRADNEVVDDKTETKRPHMMHQRSVSDGAIVFNRALDSTLHEAAVWREGLTRCRSVDQLVDTCDGRGSPMSAHSDSIENHSIKTSNIQLDHDNVSEGMYSDMTEVSSGREGPVSVMGGGSMKGWLPDVAVMMWRRILGALGDINTITDTVIHAQIYKYLIELQDVLVKIRANQGVTTDNLLTPPLPEFVPPFTIFAPWCFRALSLPDAYHRGRIYALRLLCLITVKEHDTPISEAHLVNFYQVLHNGLIDGASDTVHTLIRFTGSRFFSLALPGYSSFLLDYLAASNSIVSTQDLKGVPRTEAVSIVGSLLAFPSILEDVPLLLPVLDNFSMVTSHELKDKVIEVLLKAGKKEPSGLARCVALCSLGMFVYRELVHQTYHPKLKEAITVLVTALKFNNKAVAQVSSDMLLLLSGQVACLLLHNPDLPCKVVEVLSRSVFTLLSSPRQEAPLTAEDKRLLLSLLYCLGEWCMQLPLDVLTHVQQDGRSLLQNVFSCLITAACRPASHSPVKEMWTSSPIRTKSQPELLQGLLRSSCIEDGSECIIQLAARTVLDHLANHLDHFPHNTGATNLSSNVSEHDDTPNSTSDELTVDAFHSPNLQTFILNNRTLLTLLEIPCTERPKESGDFTYSPNQVRLIVRDVSGKFSWDASLLHSSYSSENNSVPTWDGVSVADDIPVLSPPRQITRSGPLEELPSHTKAASDLDQLDDLLQYIGHTSPEVCPIPGHHLNSLSPWPGLESEMEGDIISAILNQRNLENDRFTESKVAAAEPFQSEREINVSKCSNGRQEAIEPFQHARILFHQLGLSSREKLSSIHLVDKNEQFVRELKNLDQQKERETHKIAVIYVAEGQEDKLSILSNTGGSQGFEEFVAGLGWEVELESHSGFMGGLSRNGTTGNTAPYYASSFTEVMFHVSTRMPSSSEESMLQKTRHLGNDEIHIVWSHHWRDYRRGILPTEFCDVLIVIYPLKSKLFRIQVSRKPEVPFFGPLYNEMIVDKAVLSGLVRATAINASRAKRSMMSYYQTYYQERAKSLDRIVTKFKKSTMFEELVTSVYSPSLLGIYQGQSRFTSSSNIGAPPPPSSPKPSPKRQVGLGPRALTENSIRIRGSLGNEEQDRHGNQGQEEDGPRPVTQSLSNPSDIVRPVIQSLGYLSHPLLARSGHTPMRKRASASESTMHQSNPNNDQD